MQYTQFIGEQPIIQIFSTRGKSGIEFNPDGSSTNRRADSWLHHEYSYNRKFNLIAPDFLVLIVEAREEGNMFEFMIVKVFQKTKAVDFVSECQTY
jgi:hypothetical protein